MAKLKIRIQGMTKESIPFNQLPPAVQNWVQHNNIKEDRKGYADAPLAPGYSLFPGARYYLIPLDKYITVYQTLDQKSYYTDGKDPQPVRKRMVPYPVKCVELHGDTIKITRRSIIRGSEVAELYYETLFSGKIKDLPPSLRRLSDIHTQRLLDDLKRNEEKKNKLKTAQRKGRGTKAYSKPCIVTKGRSLRAA